jgi:hypothetical protein
LSDLVSAGFASAGFASAGFASVDDELLDEPLPLAGGGDELPPLAGGGVDVGGGAAVGGGTFTGGGGGGMVMPSAVLNTQNSDWQAYRAGVSLGTQTTAGGVESGKNFYFGARNQGDNFTAAFYCKQQLAFAFIGDGLTNTESGNFYTAVQNFNTALARQV